MLGGKKAWFGRVGRLRPPPGSEWPEGRRDASRRPPEPRTAARGEPGPAPRHPGAAMRTGPRAGRQAPGRVQPVQPDDPIAMEPVGGVLYPRPSAKTRRWQGGTPGGGLFRVGERMRTAGSTTGQPAGGRGRLRGSAQATTPPAGLRWRRSGRPALQAGSARRPGLASRRGAGCRPITSAAHLEVVAAVEAVPLGFATAGAAASWCLQQGEGPAMGAGRRAPASRWARALPAAR